LRLSENTDIRESDAVATQDDDVDGRGETADFRAFVGLLTERTRAQSLRRFTLRIGVITVELEIGDEPIGIG
jgi:hypothetical protein